MKVYEKATMNEFERGLLRYLSEEQLEKIQSVKIGIGGAGGLGSNVAMILVRSGFRNLEILDQDIIDASNLNRQQYFINEIGSSKVEITKKRLLDINPDLNITVYKITWSREIGNQFFKDSDFIVEAFDKASLKHQFVEYYQDKTPMMISGNGMAGLLEKKPMRMRKIGNIYIAGDGSTDAAAGHPPMSPRVTMCAAMMAEVILDSTLGL